MIVELCIRLRIYDDAPHKFLAVGHCDETKLRNGLSYCLLLLDNLSKDDAALLSSNSHSWSQAGEGGPRWSE